MNTMDSKYVINSALIIFNETHLCFGMNLRNVQDWP